MMQRTITVKGTGNISVSPDWIRLSLTLATSGEDYAQMARTAGVRLDALSKAVQQLGFAEDALKTESWNISSITRNYYDENNEYHEIFAGYECRHILLLAFDFDAKRLSGVLTALGQCSAKPEISVRFTVKDPDAVREKLLRDAVKNARRKAEILASEAGVKPGRLLSVRYDRTSLPFESPCSVSGGDDAFQELLPIPGSRIAPEEITAQDSAAFIWEIESFSC